MSTIRHPLRAQQQQHNQTWAQVAANPMEKPINETVSSNVTTYQASNFSRTTTTQGVSGVQASSTSQQHPTKPTYVAILRRPVLLAGNLSFSTTSTNQTADSRETTNSNI